MVGKATVGVCMVYLQQTTLALESAYFLSVMLSVRVLFGEGAVMAFKIRCDRNGILQ